ncbi:hypothetical protein P691DRAFT_759403 [Macrolepiota fuliginosa MF-IS2]|uniref:NACHT domain-containing protein n=1 Tax=Macrolepiota fuliginosa MF-IS2 TaxID=1400762 RepID=A0A9P6C596_9AGAR|nr:hypothetical protein P691DRAFT_759403 [Macrolepiota fuliginosa MF-IS2]
MPRASPPRQSALSLTLRQPPQPAGRYAPYSHPSGQPYPHVYHNSRPQLPANEPTAGQSTPNTYAISAHNYQRQANPDPGNNQGHEQTRTMRWNFQNTVRTPISPNTNSIHEPAITQSTPHAYIGNGLNHQARANRHPRNSQGYVQRGTLENAHNFAMYNPVFNDINGLDYVMIRLMEHTIPGAAFNDSARNPPPRCHPGTRLAVLRRAQNFFANPQSNKKLLWIVGPAGVGKSAIMQSLAEKVSSVNSNVVLGASLFFSVNGRNDGSKTLTTLAYQISVHDPSYRQFIRDELMNDPKLLEKSLLTQFNKFIVEPFAQQVVHGSHKRFLILIDGLDECDSNDTQCELLGLISFFCLRYPRAPLVWIIASRPEPHITAYFSRTGIALLYDKEDILINSDEARADVERYLRDELGKLRPKYPALASVAQWPSEHDFLKLSASADGLFAFASTAVRFIDDPASGNPVSQLKQVLKAIDNIPSQLRDGNIHPMSRLDALYAHILSRVPPYVLPMTKKLLLGLDNDNNSFVFSTLCDWLGLTPDIGYGALHHLHSLLRVPKPEMAYIHKLKALHKSFSDYLRNPERSEMFQDYTSQWKELEFQCGLRILNEVLDGVSSGSSAPTKCISLSWGPHFPLDFLISEHQEYHYKLAMKAFFQGFFGMRPQARQSLVHLLKLFDVVRLHRYWGRQHHDGDEFLSLLFNKDIRAELKKHQIISEVPIGELDSNIVIREWEFFGGHMVRRKESRINNTTRSDVIEDFRRSQSHSPDKLVAAYIDIQNRGWLCHELTSLREEAHFIPYRFSSLFGT